MTRKAGLHEDSVEDSLLSAHLAVAESEGDPGADLGAEAAQPDGDEPCALRVRHKAPECILHQPLTRPEPHADPRVPPVTQDR